MFKYQQKKFEGKLLINRERIFRSVNLGFFVKCVKNRFQYPKKDNFCINLPSKKCHNKQKIRQKLYQK
jgi:hypothetical protein